MVAWGRAALVSGVIGVVGAPAIGQGACPAPTTIQPIVVTQDQFFDDTAPYDVFNGPATYLQVNTLRVAAFDIDDMYLAPLIPPSRKELIYGGNGTAPNVAIMRLVGHAWMPGPCPPFPTPDPSCDSPPVPLFSDSLPEDDDFSGRGTSALYDFDVGDINEDGWLDIVVGRRLSQQLFTAGERDTAYFNRGTVIGPGADMCVENYYLNSSALEIQPAAGATMGATFGLALGHISSYPGEGNDHLDLVTCGEDYGIRYYRGYGTGLLTASTQVPPEGYTTGNGNAFRHVRLGDVDGDTDLDMIVTRLNHTVPWNPTAPVNPNTIWFNQKYLYDDVTGQFFLNPSHDPDDPFALSDQPPLKLPEPTEITWVGKSGTCAQGATGSSGKHYSTYESALGDMDGDGDLDLVVTSIAGANAIYLNNGKGFFGSKNVQSGHADKNDGCPAFAFPAVTADWTGSSECLVAYYRSVYLEQNQPDPFPCAFDDYEFMVPGEQLNVCTGVALGDVNRDGLPDVAFSNRTTWPEVCACNDTVSLPVFPAPDVYEYVFLNQSLPGSISFCSEVERIEGPNDGTSYSELVLVNDDRRPDWLDANFSNSLEGEINRLFWGRTLTVYACSQQEMAAGPSGLVEVPVQLTLDLAWAGQGYQFLCSTTGSSGGFKYGGAEIPLMKDVLTEAMIGSPELFPGSAGKLNEDAEVTGMLGIPAVLVEQVESIWLIGVAVMGDEVGQVSSVVEVQLGGGQ